MNKCFVYSKLINIHHLSHLLQCVHDPPFLKYTARTGNDNFPRFSSKLFFSNIKRNRLGSVNWKMLQKYKLMFRHGYPLYINDFYFERWSKLTEKAVYTNQRLFRQPRVTPHLAAHGCAKSIAEPNKWSSSLMLVPMFLKIRFDLTRSDPYRIYRQLCFVIYACSLMGCVYVTSSKSQTQNLRVTKGFTLIRHKRC